MFNIKLNKNAKSLLDEVEQLYGKKIREEEVQNWELERQGECSIDAYGTPVIKINHTIGRTEENIVHELFHLKLCALGFPWVVYDLPSRKRTNVNVSYLKRLGNYLFDPILHAIFYPELAKLGFDPNAQQRKQAEFFIGIDDFPLTTSDELKSLYYFIVAIQINDPNLTDRFAGWYNRKNWTKSLEAGETLEKLYKQSKPKTPEDCISLYIECLNTLLYRQAWFEMEGWQTKNFGLYRQRIAIIRVLLHIATELKLMCKKPAPNSYIVADLT